MGNFLIYWFCKPIFMILPMLTWDIHEKVILLPTFSNIPLFLNGVQYLAALIIYSLYWLLILLHKDNTHTSFQIHTDHAPTSIPPMQILFFYVPENVIYKVKLGPVFVDSVSTKKWILGSCVIIQSHWIGSKRFVN